MFQLLICTNGCCPTRTCYRFRRGVQAVSEPAEPDGDIRNIHVLLRSFGIARTERCVARSRDAPPFRCSAFASIGVSW